ncbi:GDP-L-fucose synthase [Thiocystis violacea]|uniref:GDP-L-fucose synthase n=1 Tax=Thiocystis violacea TaxID=13725 RepID=UPI001902D85F|nr:GDP-L-fucose synthase [Thiocystis violacea]MBK1718421.1 GDP-fucose synthetase [Thiocystis violacea]
MNPIYIAGHRGMVGAAIVRQLQKAGEPDLRLRSHAELDLTNQFAVDHFFATERPACVYLAAAKVGGIWANNAYPADFIYQNLMIEANLIHAAYRHGVKRLLLLGSSCIYPRLAEQPMREEALLTGTLEPTNEPYAIAKIAGIKLCESYNRQYGTDFRSVMPTNLYGPGDNFDLEQSHVIPALIRKLHEAKLEQAPSVEIWGTGQARREFLHVDDMAQACVHVMGLDQETYQSHTHPMLSHINVGVGTDVSIGELAEQVKAIVGFSGDLCFNPAKPDGTPRKLLDVSRLGDLGWRASIGLREGLEQTYAWFLQNPRTIRTRA